MLGQVRHFRTDSLDHIIRLKKGSRPSAIHYRPHGPAAGIVIIRRGQVSTRVCRHPCDDLAHAVKLYGMEVTGSPTGGRGGELATPRAMEIDDLILGGPALHDRAEETSQPLDLEGRHIGHARQRSADCLDPQPTRHPRLAAHRAFVPPSPPPGVTRYRRSHTLAACQPTNRANQTGSMGRSLPAPCPALSPPPLHQPVETSTS